MPAYTLDEVVEKFIEFREEDDYPREDLDYTIEEFIEEEIKGWNISCGREPDAGITEEMLTLFFEDISIGADMFWDLTKEEREAQLMEYKKEFEHNLRETDPDWVGGQFKEENEKELERVMLRALFYKEFPGFDSSAFYSDRDLLRYFREHWDEVMSGSDEDACALMWLLLGRESLASGGDINAYLSENEDK